MKQNEQNSSQLDQMDQQAEPIKKVYHSPKLSEYGNVTKITLKMSAGVMTDANGMFMFG